MLNALEDLFDVDVDVYLAKVKHTVYNLLKARVNYQKLYQNH